MKTGLSANNYVSRHYIKFVENLKQYNFRTFDILKRDSFGHFLFVTICN